MIEFDPGSTESQNMLKDWLATIGLLVMFWTPIERSIDICVHILYRYFDGGAIRNRKPRLLEDKLNFIRECLDQNSNLFQGQENIISLIDDTKMAGHIRHVCVHGWIEEWDSEKLKIGKYKKSDDHIKEIYTLDKHRLNKAAGNLMDLNIRWKKIEDHFSGLIEPKT